MAFRFRKAAATTADARRSSGDWYADPYRTGARRWYDAAHGWTDRVQGAGLEPDKTGVARVDEATHRHMPGLSTRTWMDPDNRLTRGDS
jgi:hypothetical protein